ncbi:MAG: tRNA (adenine(9)-N1)-methyltransferase Trm10 [Vulcanisaeta sp.]
MLLGKQLLVKLRDMGIHRLCLPRALRCRDYLPQCVAVALLLGKYVLCSGGSGGRTILSDGNVELAFSTKEGNTCDAQLVKPNLCEKPLSISLPLLDKPRFIIDLALWDSHTRSEKNELIEQVLASIVIIRKYLWDGNLELTSVPSEFLEYLGRFAKGFINKVVIKREGPVVGNDAVMLDPQGDCILDNSVINRYSTFIIGGIVDKERRVKGETTRLYETLGLRVPRCRIELRGSIVGVPDRINKIIEIILRTLFETGDLERSIIMAMSKKDRVNRLFYEINKASYRIKIENNVVLALTRSMIPRINWVNASDDEIELAIRKSHVVIIEDQELNKYLTLNMARPGPWTYKYVK